MAGPNDPIRPAGAEPPSIGERPVAGEGGVASAAESDPVAAGDEAREAAGALADLTAPVVDLPGPEAFRDPSRNLRKLIYLIVPKNIEGHPKLVTDIEHEVMRLAEGDPAKRGLFILPTTLRHVLKRLIQKAEFMGALADGLKRALDPSLDSKVLDDNVALIVGHLVRAVHSWKPDAILALLSKPSDLAGYLTHNILPVVGPALRLTDSGAPPAAGAGTLTPEVAAFQRDIAKAMQDHPEFYWEMNCCDNLLELLAHDARLSRSTDVRILWLLPRYVKDSQTWQSNRNTGLKQGAPLVQSAPWRHHIVLEIAGRVYDFDYAGKPGEPIDSYFQRMFPGQQVDVIAVPATEYLGDVNYFREGEFMFEDEYRRYAVESYIGRNHQKYGKQERYEELEDRGDIYQRHKPQIDARFTKRRCEVHYVRRLGGRFDMSSLIQTLFTPGLKRLLDTRQDFDELFATVELPEGMEVPFEIFPGWITNYLQFTHYKGVFELSIRVGGQSPHAFRFKGGEAERIDPAQSRPRWAAARPSVAEAHARASVSSPTRPDETRDDRAEEARRLASDVGDDALRDQGHPLWAPHLERNRKNIDAVASSIESERRGDSDPAKRPAILVLGAGSCRDVPLAELARDFRVVLVDYNEVDLKKAIADLSPDLQPYVTYRVRDLTAGTVPQVVARLQEILVASSPSSIGEAVRQISELFRTQEAAIPDFSEGDRFDLVVDTMLISQLFDKPIERLRETFGRLFGQHLVSFPEFVVAFRTFIGRLEKAHLEGLAPEIKERGARLYLATEVSAFWEHLVTLPSGETKGAAVLFSPAGDQIDGLADYLAAISGVSVGESDRWLWHLDGKQTLVVESVVVRPTAIGREVDFNNLYNALLVWRGEPRLEAGQRKALSEAIDDGTVRELLVARPEIREALLVLLENEAFLHDPAVQRILDADKAKAFVAVLEAMGAGTNVATRDDRPPDLEAAIAEQQRLLVAELLSLSELAPTPSSMSPHSPYRYRRDLEVNDDTLAAAQADWIAVLGESALRAETERSRTISDEQRRKEGLARLGLLTHQHLLTATYFLDATKLFDPLLAHPSIVALPPDAPLTIGSFGAGFISFEGEDVFQYAELGEIGRRYGLPQRGMVFEPDQLLTAFGKFKNVGIEIFDIDPRVIEAIHADRLLVPLYHWDGKPFSQAEIDFVNAWLMPIADGEPQWWQLADGKRGYVVKVNESRRRKIKTHRVDLATDLLPKGNPLRVAVYHRTAYFMDPILQRAALLKIMERVCEGGLILSDFLLTKPEAKLLGLAIDHKVDTGGTDPAGRDRYVYVYRKGAETPFFREMLGRVKKVQGEVSSPRHTTGGQAPRAAVGGGDPESGGVERGVGQENRHDSRLLDPGSKDLRSAGMTRTAGMTAHPSFSWMEEDVIRWIRALPPSLRKIVLSSFATYLNQVAYVTANLTRHAASGGPINLKALCEAVNMMLLELRPFVVGEEKWGDGEDDPGERLASALPKTFSIDRALELVSTTIPLPSLIEATPQQVSRQAVSDVAMHAGQVVVAFTDYDWPSWVARVNLIKAYLNEFDDLRILISVQGHLMPRLAEILADHLTPKEFDRVDFAIRALTPSQGTSMWGSWARDGLIAFADQGAQAQEVEAGTFVLQQSPELALILGLDMKKPKRVAVPGYEGGQYLIGKDVAIVGIGELFKTAEGQFFDPKDRERAAQKMADWLGKRVIFVGDPVRGQALHHIDLYMTWLPNGTVAVSNFGAGLKLVEQMSADDLAAWEREYREEVHDVTEHLPDFGLEAYTVEDFLAEIKKPNSPLRSLMAAWSAKISVAIDREIAQLEAAGVTVHRVPAVPVPGATGGLTYTNITTLQNERGGEVMFLPSYGKVLDGAATAAYRLAGFAGKIVFVPFMAHSSLDSGGTQHCMTFFRGRVDRNEPPHPLIISANEALSLKEEVNRQWQDHMDGMLSSNPPRDEVVGALERQFGPEVTAVLTGVLDHCIETADITEERKAFEEKGGAILATAALFHLIFKQYAPDQAANGEKQKGYWIRPVVLAIRHHALGREIPLTPAAALFAMEATVHHEIIQSGWRAGGLDLSDPLTEIDRAFGHSKDPAAAAPSPLPPPLEGGGINGEVRALQISVAQAMQDHPEVFWDESCLTITAEFLIHHVPRENYPKVNLLIFVHPDAATADLWESNDQFRLLPRAELVRPEGRWMYHAVLEVAGRVYDYDYKGRPGTPLSTYVREMFGDQVLDVVTAPVEQLLAVWGRQFPIREMLFENGNPRVVATEYLRSSCEKFGEQKPFAGLEPRSKSFVPTDVRSTVSNGVLLITVTRPYKGHVDPTQLVAFMKREVVKNGKPLIGISIRIKMPKGSEIDEQGMRDHLEPLLEEAGVVGRVKVEIDIKGRPSAFVAEFDVGPPIRRSIVSSRDTAPRKRTPPQHKPEGVHALEGMPVMMRRWGMVPAGVSLRGAKRRSNPVEPSGSPRSSTLARDDVRDSVIRLATERGLSKSARVAERLSERALAALGQRERLKKVLARTGYGWVAVHLGPSERKIAATDLLLLGLAALARSDDEVGKTLHKISPQTGCDVATSRFPLGFAPVNAAVGVRTNLLVPR